MKDRSRSSACSQGRERPPPHHVPTCIGTCEEKVVAPKEKETKVIPSLFSSSFGGVGGENWRWTNTAFSREKRLTGMMWRMEEEKKGLFLFFLLSFRRGGWGEERSIDPSRWRGREFTDLGLS